MILKIFLFIFFAYGLTFGLVYSDGLFHVFSLIRSFADKYSKQLSELLQCTFCTPCQIGLWASLFNILVLPSIPFTPAFLILNNINLWWMIIPFDCFFTGSVVHLIDAVETLITNKSEK